MSWLWTFLSHTRLKALDSRCLSYIHRIHIGLSYSFVHISPYNPTKPLQNRKPYIYILRTIRPNLRKANQHVAQSAPRDISSSFIRQSNPPHSIYQRMHFRHTHSINTTVHEQHTLHQHFMHFQINTTDLTIHQYSVMEQYIVA